MKGLLEGKAAGFGKLLVSVVMGVKVEQVEGRGNAGIRGEEFCRLIDGALVVWELGSNVGFGIKTRGCGIDFVNCVDNSPDQISCLICEPVA